MRKIVAALCAVAAMSTVAAAAPADAAPHQSTRTLPLHIHGGAWPTSHVQGVALDREHGYMYWSFTQMLVKTDLAGNVIGTVEGLTGHLGDLDINPKDGRIYGSLEYKEEQAFYIAIFDGDRIDRVGMDAERDGVMTTVYLDEVVKDFTADMDGNGVFDGDTADTPDHRYGSSGIDGVAFGPAFGRRHGKPTLKVAYGVYSNTARLDNDHQVILDYDVSRWRRFERPLTQDAPHHSGPRSVDGKYFVYTGNTTYGVQNLEYDGSSGNWMLAVYKGKKAQFPNYGFFIVDGSERPRRGLVRGQAQPEFGQLLSLLPAGLYDPASGTFGWEFHGHYGLVSLDDGRFYVAEASSVSEDGVAKQAGDVDLYRWTGAAPAPFERVTTP